MRVVVVRVARRFATPALLVVAMAVWFTVRSTGMAAVVCSVVVSGAAVSALVGLEWLLPHQGLAPRPIGTLVSDLCFNALTMVVAIILPAIAFVPLGRALGGVLGTMWLWPVGLSPWLAVVACVLIVDFTSYWWHRLQHTTGDSWLWRLHSVHHAPHYFDLWIGARVHPLDVFVFTVVGYTMLGLVGAPVGAIDVTAFFASMVGLMHHTRLDADCGWLNRIIPFADQHVVHHSVRVEQAGNYGNITTLFDQLFGTWRAPTPRSPAPVGAWSLAPDYPQGDFVFQLMSPFGRRWERARRTPTPIADVTDDPGRAATVSREAW
jgi:sterol desaturase/sphingolipid hydroxylase (fatty acid hydroxylase superfamily)